MTLFSRIVHVIGATSWGRDLAPEPDAQAVVLDSQHSDSQCTRLDSEESISSSLSALNSCLVFYERQWQRHREENQALRNVEGTKLAGGPNSTS